MDMLMAAAAAAAPLPADPAPSVQPAANGATDDTAADVEDDGLATVGIQVSSASTLQALADIRSAVPAVAV